MKKITVLLAACLLPIISFSAIIDQLIVDNKGNATPQTIPYSIDKINKIDYVVTAGQYAWAVDGWGGDTDRSPSAPITVAFYDGKSWLPGQSFVTNKKINMVYPAYPNSGKEATAWLLSADDPGAANSSIFYFDGYSWSKDSQSIPNLFHVSAQEISTNNINFVVSEGVAYLFRTDNRSGICSVLIGKNGHWSDTPITLGAVTDLAGATHYGQSVVYYAVGDAVYLLDSEGKISSDAYAPCDDCKVKISAMILTAGENIYLSYGARSIEPVPFGLAFENPTTDYLWTPVKPGLNFDTQYPNNGLEHAGTLCGLDFIDDTKAFRCINTDGQSDLYGRWSKPIVFHNTGIIDVNTRTNGAWLLIEEKEPSTHYSIYTYDLRTQTLTNTCAINNSPASNDICKGADLYIVGYNNRFAFATPKHNSNSKLYYYDNNNSQAGWQQLATRNIKSPDLSWSIAPASPWADATGSRSLPDDNSSSKKIWLFNHRQ